MINSQLQLFGVLHRTGKEIQAKIAEIETSVAEAEAMLAASGRASLDSCDQQTKSRVLTCCPEFSILAPVILPHLAPNHSTESLHRPEKRKRRSEDSGTVSRSSTPSYTTAPSSAGLADKWGQLSGLAPEQ